MVSDRDDSTRQARGSIDTPLRNKGTAFTVGERQELGLEGLFPYRVETIEEQLARIRFKLDAAHTDLERHVFLRALQDTNEVLFYRFVIDNLDEVLPLVYTPTVGDACEEFSHIWRRPRGSFLSYPDRDRITEILDATRARRAPDAVDVIVITDGERILGLGDQGVGGMGIPVGKLSLYVACGGIDPSRTLALFVDVGTNNESLLSDPLYLGWRHERVVGDEYDAFIDDIVDGIGRAFPGALLQWEDFAQPHAAPLLERHRHRTLSFNDDIQGTAAVALAAFLSGAEAAGLAAEDHRVVIVGAGSAGTGIASYLAAAFVDLGLGEADARSRIRLVDRGGLLVGGDGDLDALPLIQRPWVLEPELVEGWTRDGDGGISLAETVHRWHPTALIGVSGQPGLFDEALIREMASHVERPLVMALSNPTSRAEAIPRDVLEWSDGRALVASGSPFDPVELDGVTYHVAQANNVYIFPGLGMGTLVAGASEVTDGMIRAAAAELGVCAPCASGERGAALLPPLADVRSLSRRIALAVARQAVVDGVADPATDEELLDRIAERYWDPVYRRLAPT